MKTNLVIISFALILLLIASLFEVNFLNYSSPIPYTEWKSITLQSFKGFKKPSQTLHGENEFAFIETNREINFLSDNELEINSYFYPSRSYVYDEQIRSEALLRHELYHFHIKEWHTRLLRKKIVEFDGPLSSPVIEQWNQEFLELENQRQREYDSDSYHSYVLKEQKRWEALVDSNLEALDPFSNPIITLKSPE